MNILITGNRKVGKSTFINKILENDLTIASALQIPIVYNISYSKTLKGVLHNLHSNEEYTLEKNEHFTKLKDEICLCHPHDEFILEIYTPLISKHISIFERNMDESDLGLIGKKMNLAVILLPAHGLDALSKKSFENYILGDDSFYIASRILVMAQNQSSYTKDQEYFSRYSHIALINCVSYNLNLKQIMDFS